MTDEEWEKIQYNQSQYILLYEMGRAYYEIEELKEDMAELSNILLGLLPENGELVRILQKYATPNLSQERYRIKK